MPHTHFECPFCEADVPATLEQLHDAAAVLDCPGCRRPVYLTAGKVSNYQPGDQPGQPVPYDSGD